MRISENVTPPSVPCPHLSSFQEGAMTTSQKIGLLVVAIFISIASFFVLSTKAALAFTGVVGVLGLLALYADSLNDGNTQPAAVTASASSENHAQPAAEPPNPQRPAAPAAAGDGYAGLGDFPDLAQKQPEQPEQLDAARSQRYPQGHHERFGAASVPQASSPSPFRQSGFGPPPPPPPGMVQGWDGKFYPQSMYNAFQ